MSKASQKSTPPAAHNAEEPTARSASARKSTLARRFGEFLDDVHLRPLTDYYLILIAVSFLTALGVVMVFSSSMTWSVIDGNSVWATATRQAMMVVAGLIAMWIALRLRPSTLRRMAPWLLVIAFVLLIIVFIPGIGTGREEVGSQSWIVLGPIRLQPSEVAKVAIAVWGASYLTSGSGSTTETRRFWIFGAVSACIALLIFGEGDGGMGMTFCIMVAVVGFFGGINLRIIVGALVIAVIGVVGMSLRGGFRSDRFTVYFDALVGRFEDTRGTSFQSYQGFLSLADGSISGVGLGQSRAKWFYLPEAKNDFIFAIVGEELGLWGGIFVIAAFTALGFYGIRCAMRSKNKFLGLMAASLTAGVVVQAFINIGYVVGLLPVTGIQLPMISAGGTSAIITLASMGLLASCARHEPEAISAMQSYGMPLLDRILRLREPDVFDGGNRRSVRPKAAPARTSVPVTRRQQEQRARQGEARDAGTVRREGSGSIQARRDSQQTMRRVVNPRDPQQNRAPRRKS